MRTETASRGVFVGEVCRNERLCEEHALLGIRLGQFPPARPGQFVQLQCRGLDEQIGAREVRWPAEGPPQLTQPELTGKEPLLRRPFSLAAWRQWDRGVALEILYRAVGTGTHWLWDVPVGTALSVLGPLGNGFAIRPEATHAALVGGGVGIPPMLFLAEHLAAAGKTAVAFCGVRTEGLLPLTVCDRPGADGRPSRCIEEFARHGAESVIATDDGTLGWPGLVSGALAAWLDGAAPGPADLVVYSCGPEPMMRAVADLCIARGIECQLALERHMACGMGTCQSCIVKIRDDGARGWSYKLCCTDGPVFDAREVLWE